MELLLGSHVLEHGKRVGRLAGFELESAERRVRRIIFSPDGELGPQAMTRPVTAVTAASGRTVTLSASDTHDALPAVRDVMLLSRATRLVVGGHEAGRLTGIGVNPADRSLASVSGRQHWWSKRVTIPGDQLDTSSPGQLRQANRGSTQAA